MLKVLLPAALLLTGLMHSAQAQVEVHFKPLHTPTLRYGLRVGGQVAGINTPQSGYSNATPQRGLWGGNAGVTAEADLGWLAIQPAVLFTQKGYRIQDSRTETFYGKALELNTLTRLRLNYLEVPVNLVATVHGFQLLAGPYVSVALSGRYHNESTVPIPIGSETSHDFTTYHYTQDEKVYFTKKGRNYDDIVARRLDAGFNVGVGYRYKGWQVQPTYTRGIRYTGYGYQAKNWSAQLNLSYYFTPSGT